MPPLRVAIDLTQLGPPAALGLPADRLAHEAMPVRFVEAMLHQAPGVEFVVLARASVCAALAPLDTPNARLLSIAEPVQTRSVLARVGARVRRRLRRTRFAGRLPRLSGVWSRVRPGILARLGANVVFCPFVDSGIADQGVPLVAAVHDLQHLSHAFLLSSADRQARAEAFDTTRRRAARLVCSTPALRDVVLACDGLLAERIVSVSPGPLLVQPSAAQSGLEPTLRQYALEPNGYLLVVADLEPRHNHRVVLAAMSLFRLRHPDSSLRLAWVGGPDLRAAELTSIAARMHLAGSVQFLGPLARQEISLLVQGCRALVVPSLYETLGERMLEAMQLGRPVLCSRPELTGGAALAFDPHRPAELAAAFERIEQDTALLEALGHLGQERASTLGDARSVAQAYLDVFREAQLACPTSR